MRQLWIVAVVIALSGPCPAARAERQPAIAYEPGLLIQLAVSSLDRSIAFYTNMLGFELTERRNDLKFAHIQTNVPGLHIGLNEIPESKGSGSAVLNISVKDVAIARGQLEGRGVGFRGETVVIPGKVALAQFADPDGNVLRFAGPPKK